MNNDVSTLNNSNQGSGQTSPPPTSTIRNTESVATLPSRRHMTEASRSNGAMASARNASISVAVDPVALIITECITVTSAMRKHARWAHSSVSAILGGTSTPLSPNFQTSRPPTPRDEAGRTRGPKNRSSIGVAEDDGGLANRWGLRGKKGKSMQDNPLMAGFGRLRRELTGCKG